MASPSPEELEAMLLKSIPRYRWTADDVVKDLHLKGKTIVVTGATSGIGIPTATALARTGCNLVITARDPSKGAAALESIRKESGNPEVNVKALDLCSFASVTAFAKDWGDQPIDVLLHNAGVMAIPLTMTPDKEEQQMQVNFHSVVLLTELLLPRITETGRICVLSSVAHRRCATYETPFMELFDKYAFQGISEESYDKWVAYAVAKSAIIMYCNQLNAELTQKGSKIRVNSCHPGGIRTGLQDSLSQEEMVSMGWIDKDGNVSPVFKTVEQGASTSTWLAVSSEMEGVGGTYSEDCAVTAKDVVLLSPVKGTAPHVWVEADCLKVSELARAHLKEKGLL